MSQQPGRELDAEVAAKVMGWTSVWSNLRDLPPKKVGGKFFARVLLTDDPEELEWVGVAPSGQRSEEIPPYSTNLAAAWLVVEAMQKYDCDFSLEKAGAAWYADFRINTDVPAGTSAPHAICLAALQSLAAESPHE